MVHWSNNLLVLALTSVALAVFGPGLVGLLLIGGEMGVRFGFVVSPCLLVIALVSLIGALLMRRAARDPQKRVRLRHSAADPDQGDSWETRTTTKGEARRC